MKAQKLYKKIKEKYPNFEPEQVQELPKPPDDSITDENRWMGQRFNCNIADQFLTEEEIELIHNGFKVDKKIPEDHVLLHKGHVDKIIEKVNS